MSEVVIFIEKAGGCVVSKNILSHKGKLKWCVRENPIYGLAVGTGAELRENNGKTFIDNNTGKIINTKA